MANKPPTNKPSLVIEGIDYYNIPFLQAKCFTEVPEKEPRNVSFICIHDMELPMDTRTAERCAQYFHTMDDGRQASAHYCVDPDSIIQCVQCKDVAWGAKMGNQNGIHIELAGYENLSRMDWLKDSSTHMLTLAARLCAKVLMPKFGIQPIWLSKDQVQRAREDHSIKGFTTHRMVTAAFNVPGGHTDPGDGFPFNEFMELVKKAAQS